MTPNPVAQQQYEAFVQSFQYRAVDSVPSEQGRQTHFRYYFFEHGSGTITMHQRQRAFLAPCCRCLNEQEQRSIQTLKPYVAHVIWFTPTVINAAFNFDNIREQPQTFTHSEMLDLYWLTTFLDRSAAYDGMMLVGLSTAQRMLELCQRIGKELTEQRGDFWPCRSRSFLFELFQMVNTLHANPLREEPLAPYHADEQMQPVIQYLNEQYPHKITIAALTRRFHTNRTTLSERFLRATSLSVMAYLTKLRIKMACVFLRDTALSISEIMDRVGFEDRTHFGRVFKKETSFSLAEYRQQHTRMN